MEQPYKHYVFIINQLKVLWFGILFIMCFYLILCKKDVEVLLAENSALLLVSLWEQLLTVPITLEPRIYTSLLSKASKADWTDYLQLHLVTWFSLQLKRENQNSGKRVGKPVLYYCRFYKCQEPIKLENGLVAFLNTVFSVFAPILENCNDIMEICCLYCLTQKVFIVFIQY